jgi:hypothetical protein
LCATAGEAFKHKDVANTFALDVAQRALDIESFLNFGPYPVEIEDASSLVEACYVKARCIAKGSLMEKSGFFVDEEPAEGCEDALICGAEEEVVVRYMY